MERIIVHKLRESRGVSLGTYKGYNISLDRENNVLVTKNGKVIVSCENEKEAYEYIDQAPSNNLVPKSSVKYCIKISFPGEGQWFYLCKDGHYKRESYITKQNIRVFDAKNKAEQALKYSTRSLDCEDKKVEIFQ